MFNKYSIKLPTGKRVTRKIGNPLDAEDLLQTRLKVHLVSALQRYLQDKFGPDPHRLAYLHVVLSGNKEWFDDKAHLFLQRFKDEKIAYAVAIKQGKKLFGKGNYFYCSKTNKIKSYGRK